MRVVGGAISHARLSLSNIIDEQKNRAIEAELSLKRF